MNSLVLIEAYAFSPVPLPFGIHDLHRLFRAKSHPEMIGYGKAIEFHTTDLGLSDKLIYVTIKFDSFGSSSLKRNLNIVFSSLPPIPHCTLPC